MGLTRHVVGRAGSAHGGFGLQARQLDADAGEVGRVALAVGEQGEEDALGAVGQAFNGAGDDIVLRDGRGDGDEDGQRRGQGAAGEEAHCGGGSDVWC